MFENMYFVKLFTFKHENRKHINLKDIKLEYGLSYYDLFYSLSFVYMYACKLKNMNICNEIVLSWFSLLTVT